MYYPTQTSDIVERIMKNDYPGGKQPNKQHILKKVSRIERMGSLHWLLGGIDLMFNLAFIK